MEQKIRQNKCAIADSKFWACWKNGEYTKAISVYKSTDRPFWLAEKVGRYYESRGQLNKAMLEYEYLMDEYRRIKLLPLPKGPEELFKLGKWYINKDRAKARQYLKLYLSAEEKCKSDPAFYLSHKEKAEKILICIQQSGNVLSLMGKSRTLKK